MEKLLTFFLFNIINIYIISCLDVAFDIKPNKNFCMGEYITEETVVIFTLKSKSKNLIIELHDPKGNVIYSKKNKLEIKVSLTASESGNYEMCVKNNDKKMV